MRRVFRMASLVGIVAILAMGCGDDAPGGGNNNDNANHNINQNCLPVLTIQGATTLDLMINAQADLTVLVADCNGDPIPSTIVSFEVGGNNGGAVLNVASAVAASDGLASVTLTAGASNATFTVTASTPGASDVTWNVTVTSDPIGMIVVNMTYAGEKVFDTYESYLFQNNACAGIDPMNIQGAVMGAAPVNVISAHPQFPGVPQGSNYSVAVVASWQGEVLAWGCVDSLTVSPGAVTDANVTIDDIPVSFNGLYYLDNNFDLTNALPPTVATIIQIFDEITDDHSLDGDSATNQYGLDPAAFLLDLIFRQFCCWTAEDTDSGTPGIQADWDSCNPQAVKHPYGDLQALYDENFTSWDGAQPIVSYVCGALDMNIGGQELHKHAQEYVQTWIDNNAPATAMNILQIVGDIARIFTQMHIFSELTVADVDISKQGDFTHELKTLEIVVHDLNGDPQTFLVNLVAAGMTTLSYTGSTSATDTTLNIPPHTFVLEFGELVQYIYLNYILPLFNVTNTGDLLASWINCTSIGSSLHAWLVDVNGLIGSLLTEQQVQGFCTSGLQAAGNYIDNSIATWINVSADFTLEGTCEAGDLDEDRVAITLVNGDWDGTLEEGTWNSPFAGDFTGSKTAP